MKINKELIKLLIKKKSLKQKDVALQLEVSPQDFNNWMFRGIFPHYNKLEKLADILETDVAELHIENNISEPFTIYGKKLSFTPDELLPFYELDQHVGLSAIWDNDGSLEPKDFVYLPGLNANFLMTYYGNGMEPQLENGDWMALRRVSDLTFFNYGSIHVIATKEQIIVRTLKKGEQKGTINLCTNKKSIDDIELPKKAIKALYVVVSIVKRNLI
ncbi:MAG: repressor LexA [Crocinitomix sp.]|jgi:repressor LexA